jgi:hypothetical protein
MATPSKSMSTSGKTSMMGVSTGRTTWPVILMPLSAIFMSSDVTLASSTVVPSLASAPRSSITSRNALL